MKKNLLLFILSYLLAILFLPGVVSAQITITGMVGNVEKILLYVAGGIVVIFWIITGILFLAALGAPEKLGTAKKALLFAVIGTIIIILAYGAEGMINSALSSGT